MVNNPDITITPEVSRTALLVGGQGVTRLKAARVIVAGIGGVGSYAAEALARAGIGNLALVDCDVIAPSNINRQIHALFSTVGRPKAEVMAERIQQINPLLKVTPLKRLITPENIYEFLESDYDLVVDAIDSFKAKLALIRYCVEQQVQVISSMGAAGRLDPARVRIAELSESHGCRLARKLRKELRRCGISKGVTVVYSDEPCCSGLQGDADDDLDPRRPLGSISYLPAVFGLFIAAEVVKRILTSQVMPRMPQHQLP